MEKKISKSVLDLTERLGVLDDEELHQFLKLNGLFYLYEASLEHYIDNEGHAINEDIVYFEDLFCDECCSPEQRQEIAKKFLSQVEKDFGQKSYIVINTEDLFQYRMLGGTKNQMTMVDSCGSREELMVLAKKGEEQKYINQYKLKQKRGYDDIDVWNPNTAICKAVLPNLLKEYSKGLHGNPPELTMEEWQSILLRMIWFCQEMVNSHDEYKVDSNKREAYNKCIDESRDLFCKYFFDLWD